MSPDAAKDFDERIAAALVNAEAGSFFRAGHALGELRRRLLNHEETPTRKRVATDMANAAVRCMQLELRKGSRCEK